MLSENGAVQLDKELRLKGVVPGAHRGIAVRDVIRPGQEPGLGVAVALVANTHSAVHVSGRFVNPHQATGQRYRSHRVFSVAVSTDFLRPLHADRRAAHHHLDLVAQSRLG